MPDDWFRNSDWNPAIEALSFDRLRRARKKEQYLVIQAGYLVERHPTAALALLDRYFATGDRFHMAQALVEQATAYLALCAKQGAIELLQRALRCERESRIMKTNAWSQHALLVATDKLEHLYDDALRVLEENKDHATFFRVDGFLWYAAGALIADARGHWRRADVSRIGLTTVPARPH